MCVSRLIQMAIVAALFSAASAVARAECVPFSNARKLEGQPGCVTGRVVKVTQSRSGNWYLDFCEDYRQCPFSVFIPKADAEKLGDLVRLEGQPVQIYGKVKPYNGRSEIVLRDKRQLDGEKSKYVPPDQ